MDLSRPYAALCPTLDADVLVALAGTRRPLTGREVARLAGRGSHVGVRDVLVRVVEHGLVDQQEAGTALLYTLNREHLAAPAVAVLADMRSDLVLRLRSAIETWDILPIHASMFGSAARGDGNTQSDIDIFIIRPTAVDADDDAWRGQLDTFAASVLGWAGNDARIAEVGEAEIPRLREAERPIVRNLRQDAISLYGDEASQFLGASL